MKKWNHIACSGFYAAWPIASRFNAVDSKLPGDPLPAAGFAAGCFLALLLDRLPYPGAAGGFAIFKIIFNIISVILNITGAPGRPGGNGPHYIRHQSAPGYLLAVCGRLNAAGYHLSTG